MMYSIFGRPLTVNPLIPEPVDVVLTVACMLAVLLTIVGVVSWLRHTGQIDTAASLLWLALIIFIPVVGPLGWFCLAAVANRTGGANKT